MNLMRPQEPFRSVEPYQGFDEYNEHYLMEEERQKEALRKYYEREKSKPIEVTWETIWYAAKRGLFWGIVIGLTVWLGMAL